VEISFYIFNKEQEFFVDEDVSDMYWYKRFLDVVMFGKILNKIRFN